MWKYFDRLGLKSRNNIVSLGEGNSPIIELPELSPLLGGAGCYLMLDSHHNPTKTFKDREGSLIISICKEAGLDQLVFYSTANTGRSYTHYAAHAGLRTYCFLPAQCSYKNLDSIARNRNNHMIYVKGRYAQVAPYAMRFAQVNRLPIVASIEDRIEAYTTVAYEQHEKLPQCTWFVQAIASGLGPMGFWLGCKRLMADSKQKPDTVPRLICVQSSQTNTMARNFNAGLEELASQEPPESLPETLYEPSLYSSNPIGSYSMLYRSIKESGGSILDVKPEQVQADQGPLLAVLEKRGLPLRTDLEKSILIEFSGIRRLACRGVFNAADSILIMACGRGNDAAHALIKPDAIIDPLLDDPVQLYRRLSERV
jgi:threonine synthase